MKYKNKSTNNIDIFFKNYRYIEKIKNLFPYANWEDCLSQGQVDSKLWLIDELLKLNLDLGTIFVFGGWYGTLPKFMFESDLKLDKIRSFDIDPESTEISETVNRKYVLDSWKFKSTTFDIFNLRYPLVYISLRRDKSEVELSDNPNTIINTSSEHMSSKWFEDVPKNTLVIIQSNDFLEGNGHINCSKNINELKSKFDFSKILYSGTLELQKYNRFMIIGYK